MGFELLIIDQFWTSILCKHLFFKLCQNSLFISIENTSYKGGIPYLLTSKIGFFGT